MNTIKSSHNESNCNLIVPENMGRMNDPDGSAWIDGICGDSMEMYLIIEMGMITQSKFFTDGCNASRMCGAIAARLAQGKLLNDALRISPADVIDSWMNIPDTNIHCAILAVSTLHKAIAEYLLRVQRS